MENNTNMDSYYSDGFDNNDDDVDNDSGCLLEESDDDVLVDDENYPPKNSMWRKNYVILKEFDIQKRIDDAVKGVSTVLFVSKAEATLLLCHYSWSVSKVHDAWFADESGVRKKVGLFENPVVVPENLTDLITCRICYETYPFGSFTSASCGHPYCITCWSNYVSSSINDHGIGCLKLRCPEPTCHAAVGQDLVESLVSEVNKNKYSELLLRSYVEEHRYTKWCPSPGCKFAVEISDRDGSFDVTCHCFASFCWNCSEESHRPVDCETMKKWVSKNSSESDNVNYILAYCKHCPNCKRPIEKNEGCMHMRCRVCQHDFCWICLRPYTNHVSCNSYQEPDTQSKRKEMAMQSLEKYTHYFERWDANKKSRLKALSDFQQVKNVQLERLSEVQGIPVAHFDFITRAWLQIIDCRRVLEWSYVYGFYMPDNNDTKKQFFEYLQGDAESTLEKLHSLVERELDRFLAATELSKELSDFRTKLVNLTTVNGDYFNKLLTALENGLSEVASSKPSCSRDNEEENFWLCDRCTYANPSSAPVCLMCVLSDDEY